MVIKGVDCYIDGLGRVGNLLGELVPMKNNPDLLTGKVKEFGAMRAIEVFNIPRNSVITSTCQELGGRATYAIYHICPIVENNTKSIFSEVITQKLEKILVGVNEDRRTMSMQQTVKKIEDMENTQDASAYLERQKKLMDKLQFSRNKNEQRGG